MIKIISWVFVDQQKLAIVEMIVDFKVVIARGGREALELILLWGLLPSKLSCTTHVEFDIEPLRGILSELWSESQTEASHFSRLSGYEMRPLISESRREAPYWPRIGPRVLILTSHCLADVRPHPDPGVKHRAELTRAGARPQQLIKHEAK